MIPIKDVSSVFTAVAAVAAAVSSLLNRRKIQEIKVQFNSRFDEFIEEARRVARAEGRQEVIDSQMEGKK